MAPALATRKLQYLASHGYEIGNHTVWHAELSIWLTNFERHPELRFVSDGDPRTITIPRGVRDHVAPAFASRVR